MSSVRKLLRNLLPLAAAMAALTTIPCHADDWQPISPEELKMTSEPSQPGAAAVILYHEENSDDTEGFAQSYYRIKILTEEGRKYADVKMPYYEESFSIGDLRARTIHSDGTVIAFSGKMMESTVVKGRGIKILQKTFTMPDVQVGSIIEYKYKLRWEQNMVRAPRWVVQEDLFQKRAHFTFKPYKGDVQVGGGLMEGTMVSWTLKRLPPGTDVKRKGDRVELDATNLPPFDKEEYAPPEDELKGQVRFYYIPANIRNPDQYWMRFGKQWSGDTERFIAHASQAEAAARQLVGPSDTPEQKLRKLYSRVQQIKNLTYERELSAVEAKAESIKGNKNADDVLRRGVGYHDEITQLFVAMARAVDIDAHIARIATRDDIFFNNNILDFNQLNSDVAVVTLEGKDVYLDPGTRYCPFSFLAWKRSGVEGLESFPKGDPKFIRTPMPAAKDSILQRAAALTLTNDGSAKGKVRVIFNGMEALDRRLAEHLNDEAGRTKDLEEEVREWLPASADIHLDSVKGWEGSDEPIDATFNVDIPGFAAATGKRLLMPTDLFESRPKQPFVHEQRVNDLYFDHATAVLDTVNIVLPPSMEIESAPKGQRVQEDVGGYLIKCDAQKGKLHVERQFAISNAFYPQKYYPSMKSLYQKVKASDEEPTILRIATVAQN